MVQWRIFSAYEQAVYFFFILITIQCATVAVLVRHIHYGMNYEIENRTLYYWQISIVTVMMPSNILTYRSRVFTMKILKQVKRNKKQIVG